MDYLPVFLDVRGRPCLVVGGGDVALRKVESLLRARADVTVVARRLCAGLEVLRDAGRITHAARAFASGATKPFVIAIAATDDDATNRRVAADAGASGVPVNVVDRPSLCTFILPAVVDRDPLVVAVSSAGASPVLARRVRTRIEMSLPPATGRFARLLGSLRTTVQARLATLDERRRFWEAVVDGPIAERFHAGDEDGARAQIEALLAAGGEAARGEVYLVCAGAGEADLLTLRALRLMQRAEVAICDRTVPAPILDQVRKDAERVWVDAGGEAGVGALLVRHARAGRRVLRLHAGATPPDARATEIAPLVAAGIPYRAVPGVAAAAGDGA